MPLLEIVRFRTKMREIPVAGARWTKLTSGRGECPELAGPSALRAHSYVGFGAARVHVRLRWLSAMAAFGCILDVPGQLDRAGSGRFD